MIVGTVDVSFTDNKLLAGEADKKAADADKKAEAADKKAEAAQTQANTALTSANGKNKNYYGEEEPENPKGGDLWFKPLEDGTVTPMQYNGIKWLSITDSIAQAAKDIVDSWTAPDGTSMNGQKIDGASISEEKMKWSSHLIF
ncbi:hypothetical protein [Peribacillus aracenensis]|uniref:hypothetical protein n=1 Tax=Peribacillus aracenensis TaxID=2976708 RepID=UPI0021A6C298|nr:hypothetical protein [Peribacillus sp. BBB004]